MTTVREIIAAVSAETGVSEHDILGPWRQAEICAARHLAMWLARNATHQSLPQIGLSFHRDHTSIMHGVRKVEQWRAEDADLRCICDALLSRLRETVN